MLGICIFKKMLHKISQTILCDSRSGILVISYLLLFHFIQEVISELSLTKKHLLLYTFLEFELCYLKISSLFKLAVVIAV